MIYESNIDRSDEAREDTTPGSAAGYPSSTGQSAAAKALTALAMLGSRSFDYQAPAPPAHHPWKPKGRHQRIKRK